MLQNPQPSFLFIPGIPKIQNFLLQSTESEKCGTFYRETEPNPNPEPLIKKIMVLEPATRAGNRNLEPKLEPIKNLYFLASEPRTRKNRNQNRKKPGTFNFSTKMGTSITYSR